MNIEGILAVSFGYAGLRLLLSRTWKNLLNNCRATSSGSELVKSRDGGYLWHLLYVAAGESNAAC